MGEPEARDRLKRIAAEAAVAEIADGMLVGLGSGSTADCALEAVAKRVKKGLRIEGVATSEATAARARALGIPLIAFGARRPIDLTIDGADEVARGSLDLIKGRGGALLREKIIARASNRLVIIVDDGKLVDRLGTHLPLPVEIVAFGWESTLDRLAAADAKPRLRQANGAPFITDGGNHIVDCEIGEIADAAGLEAKLQSILGVITSGLFLGMASRVIVGTASGPRSLER